MNCAQRKENYQVTQGGGCRSGNSTTIGKLLGANIANFKFPHLLKINICDTLYHLSINIGGRCLGSLRRKQVNQIYCVCEFEIRPNGYSLAWPWSRQPSTNNVFGACHLTIVKLQMTFASKHLGIIYRVSLAFQYHTRFVLSFRPHYLCKLSSQRQR